MVKGSQSYYDRIRAMTEIGHTTLVIVMNSVAQTDRPTVYTFYVVDL